MNIRRRIVELLRVYQEKNPDRRIPSFVAITPQDEKELSELPSEEMGELLHKDVQAHGVRAALPTLFGMQVVWGADTTRVFDEAP